MDWGPVLYSTFIELAYKNDLKGKDLNKILGIKTGAKLLKGKLEGVTYDQMVRYTSKIVFHSFIKSLEHD